LGLVAFPVFKTGGPAKSGPVGSIPTRLRQPSRSPNPFSIEAIRVTDSPDRGLASSHRPLARLGHALAGAVLDEHHCD